MRIGDRVKDRVKSLSPTHREWLGDVCEAGAVWSPPCLVTHVPTIVARRRARADSSAGPPLYNHLMSGSMSHRFDTDGA